MNGAPGHEVQSRFVRALEAEYAVRVERYREAGTDPDMAHERALQDVLRLEGQALEELRARGLFPWPEETTP